VLAGNEFALVRIPVLMGNLGEGSPHPAARWRETTFKSEQTVRARRDGSRDRRPRRGDRAEKCEEKCGDWG